MPIISTSFNDVGNAGQVPSIVRIETDDNLSTVLAVGYLNVLTHQNLPLSETSIVLVSTGVGVNKEVTAMRMVFSSGDWSLELLEGYQESLDGLTLPTATVASGDKVLIQDVSDSDKLKTVTAQSIANLAPGGSSILTQVTVAVPSADFLQIFGTPFLLVDAPAANEFYVVHTCIIEFDYNSVFYTAGSDVLVVYSSNWAVAATVGVANTEFHGVSDALIVCAENTSIGSIPPGNVLALGLYLAALSTDFANGDSSLRVTLTYETVTTGF